MAISNVIRKVESGSAALSLWRNHMLNQPQSGQYIQAFLRFEAPTR
jgi:hypothetical protein